MPSDDRSDERRASLLETRAAAIARDHFGSADPRTASIRGAAVAIENDRGVAVIDDPAMGVVGGLLLWVAKAGLELDAVVVEGDADTVDHWLDGFAARPAVHRLDGRELAPPGEPPSVPVLPVPPVPPEFDRADVEVVVENGVVLAEVAGLEVARVVVDGDGAERVEVGVGQYDRAAHKVMSPGPVDEVLTDVVDRVRSVRQASVKAHTFNRLCRERWLRSVLVADPSLVGLEDLVPVDPLPARTSLLDAGPAPAVGRDGSGALVLVVATTGIDLSLAVSTSAVAQREGPERVVVALPQRDRFEPLLDLMATLRWPVDVVSVEPPWG